MYIAIVIILYIVQCIAKQTREKRVRCMSCIPNEVYRILSDIVKGKFIVSKDRDKACKKAYTYFYKYAKCLSVKTVQHPVTSAKEERILFTNAGTDSCPLIVLCAEEKAECIDFFYRRSKGDSARKLKKSIDEKFCGITERDVQSFINNNPINQRIKAKFDNKAPLQPVTSLKIWERIQIDLMSMMDVPV